MATVTVAPPLTGITISPTTASVNVGGTQAFDVSPVPSGALLGTIIWTTSNSAVGTIANGLFTADLTTTGATTITATYGGFSALATVTVQDTFHISISSWPEVVNAPSTVDITLWEGGTATGYIDIEIDCHGDGYYEHIFNYDFHVQKNLGSICSYPNAGVFDLNIKATREGISSTDSTIMKVLEPGWSLFSCGGVERMFLPESYNLPAILQACKNVCVDAGYITGEYILLEQDYAWGGFGHTCSGYKFNNSWSWLPFGPPNEHTLFCICEQPEKNPKKF